MPTAPGSPTPTAERAQRRLLDREVVRLAGPALGALLAPPLFLLADAAIVGGQDFKGGHRVDDDAIHAARADERLGDLERLLAGIRL